jgi:RNA polymerase Rpb1, domain 2
MLIQLMLKRIIFCFLHMLCQVRQPCLWSGGIQPVTIRVTDPIYASYDGHKWDVNWTIRVPPGMCGPYGADFDGDEMSLFPVKSSKATLECQTYRWSYETLANPHLHSQLVPKGDITSGNGFDDI